VLSSTSAPNTGEGSVCNAVGVVVAVILGGVTFAQHTTLSFAGLIANVIVQERCPANDLFAQFAASVDAKTLP
jgi:hypothetical protein